MALSARAAMAPAIRACALLCILLIACHRSLAQQQAGEQEEEQFDEEVILKPLPGGQLLSHFHFTLTAPARRAHNVLFPAAVVALARRVPSFTELDVALTRGRWHYERWGLPPLPARPVGAEMRAAFYAESAGIPESSLEPLWGNLSHALGGMLCASLNALARPETTAAQAVDTSSPAGPAAARRRWLYAALPTEALCTENLTPWLRLLPCRDAGGLAALLAERRALFGASYQSLALRVSRHGGTLRVTQMLTLVLPAESAASGGGGGGWSATTTAAAPDEYRSWALAPTFGAALRGACPLARLSRLYVQAPEQLLLPHGGSEEGVLQAARAAGDDGGDDAWRGDAFELTPVPDAVLVARRAAAGGGYNTAPLALHAYDLVAREEQQQQQRRRSRSDCSGDGGSSHNASDAPPSPRVFELAQRWAPAAARGARAAALPAFSARHYTTGRGNVHGRMVLALHANDRAGNDAATATPTTVCVFHVVPWYVRVWLHTLALDVDGARADLDAALVLRSVAPARDRTSPLALELCVRLPRGVRRAALSADFSKGFLNIFEIPPDPYRGFDVPAARVTTFFGSVVGASAAAAAEWEVLPPFRNSADTAQQQQEQLSPHSPLLGALAAPAAQAVYADALLVPLAVPDVTMPYNVICLTSTVLAVYVGATLNALLKRPSADAAAAAAAAAPGARRRRVVKIVAVFVVFGSLALYLDEALRDEANKLLAPLGARLPF